MANKRSHIVNTRIVLVAFAMGAIIGILLAPAIDTCLPETTAPVTAPVQAESRSAVANIVAVAADTNKGIIGTATVELIPGQGRMLISANPFIEPDTQESVAIARAVAESFTGISFAQNDIIASFELAGSQAQVIGGPSAGAALTVALIAAAQNTSVRPDVAITGRILPDGRIGSVGSIIEKAEAAAEAGMKLFIVPAGQASVTYYEKVEEQTHTNGFIIIRVSYVPKTLSLGNYTQQWNMTSVEVGTVEELARFSVYNLTQTAQ